MEYSALFSPKKGFWNTESGFVSTLCFASTESTNTHLQIKFKSTGDVIRINTSKCKTFTFDKAFSIIKNSIEKNNYSNAILKKHRALMSELDHPFTTSNKWHESNVCKLAELLELILGGYIRKHCDTLLVHIKDTNKVDVENAPLIAPYFVHGYERRKKPRAEKMVITTLQGNESLRKRRGT